MLMKNKDILLLTALRRNAREKLKEVSRATKLPVSTLFDRLNILRKTHITKSTILLNFPKIGYECHALIIIKANPQQRDRLGRHLELHNNVNALYKVNNGYDFIVEAVHKNIKDLDRFLEDIKKNYGAEQHEIHYLIDEIKKESFLPQQANTGK